MLSQAQLDQLDRDGFVIVTDVLEPKRDLDPILHEYEGVLDRLVIQLRAQGRLSSRHSGLGFSDRLIQVMRETGESHSQHFDFSLPKGNMSSQTPIWLGKAVFAALTHPKLLDCVESVIGPEIYSNPVQHARLKPPERLVLKDPTGKSVLVGETPWHQDNGVLTPDADWTQMLTVWFPLCHATIENGCLIALPGSHREDLLPHCANSNAQLSIPKSLIRYRDAVPIPMERGDILMFHKRLQHASLPNNSDHVRCSFDLRYHPIGQPTGRAMFPGFVARSGAHPEKQLENRDEWAQLWFDARGRMSSAEYRDESFDRWAGKNPLCA